MLFTASSTTYIYTLSLHDALPILVQLAEEGFATAAIGRLLELQDRIDDLEDQDRKSTRLNSSNPSNSYAFYCFLYHLYLHSFPTRRSSDLGPARRGGLRHRRHRPASRASGPHRRPRGPTRCHPPPRPPAAPPRTTRPLHTGRPPARPSSTVKPSSHPDVSNYSVSGDLDGDVIVIWDRFPSQYTYARQITRTAIGQPVLLTTYGRMNWVRVDDDGDGIVVWQGKGINGSVSSVRVRQVTRSGTFGTEQVVASNGRFATTG